MPEFTGSANTSSTNNVHQLLDSVGIPPVEVCLDWAWQLLEHQSLYAESASRLNSRDFAASDSVRHPSHGFVSDGEIRLCWSQWYMTDCGQLTLDATGNQCVLPQFESEDARKVSRYVAQLLDWAGAEWPAGDDRLSPHVQQCIFRSLTRDFHGRVSKGIASVPEDQRSFPKMLNSPKLGATSTLVKQAPKRLRKKKSSHLKNSAIGLVLSVAFGGLLWLLLRPQQDSSAGLSSSSMRTQHEPETNISGSQSDPSLDPSRIVLQTTASLPQIESEIMAGDATGLSPTAVPLVTRDTVAESLGRMLDDTQGVSASGRLDGQAPFSDGQALLSDNSTVEPSEPSEPGGLTTEVVSEATSEKGIDPDKLLADAMLELGTGGIAEEPVVRELLVDSAAQQVKVIPAQLISTGSMMQVQRLPERFRVKEPVWQLKLVASDEFSIQPSVPQRLFGKAVISWTMAPQEMKQREPGEIVKVYVQAQMSGSKPDIRWKVAAASEELPWLVVPMDSDRLDWMLATTLNLQSQTTAAIEVLKTTSRSGGSSRQPGFAPLQQRKVLEQHLKALQSIERVLVDASLYVTWLGESIEVNGLLVDQVDPEQPITILQLGDGASASRADVP